MTTTEVFAPAKINLTLHVTGQRADGYHLLDSLVVFADVGDRLVLKQAEDMALRVDGPFAHGVPTDARNLVWRAARMLGVALDMQLTKSLPHGAGIGGGSSDAAAVLRHCGRGDLAAQLGADVPVCLSDAPQRMQGIGDRLEAIGGLPRLAMVLVNPGAHVPTPAVFAALEVKDNPAMGALPQGGDWLGWLAAQRNDLERPAKTIAPVIGDALAALSDALLARMSGSGSTCFGIYADRETARAAAARIAAAHADWWIVDCETVASRT